MEKIKQLDRYMNAEIMSAVIGGMFTAVIESEKEEEIFEKEEIDTEEISEILQGDYEITIIDRFNMVISSTWSIELSGKCTMGQFLKI